LFFIYLFTDLFTYLFTHVLTYLLTYLLACLHFTKSEPKSLNVLRSKHPQVWRFSIQKVGKNVEGDMINVVGRKTLRVCEDLFFILLRHFSYIRSSQLATHRTRISSDRFVKLRCRRPTLSGRFIPPYPVHQLRHCILFCKKLGANLAWRQSLGGISCRPSLIDCVS